MQCQEIKQQEMHDSTGKKKQNPNITKNQPMV